MASPAESPRRRTFNSSVSLSRDQGDILEALADAKFAGNVSRAVSHLVDVHCGKELERALQEQEAANAPVQITKWKQPTLSVELIGYVAGLVRSGNLLETACEMAGISPGQRSSWLKKGRNDRRDGRQSLMADFVAAVERADAECEVATIRQLREAGKGDYRALTWLLARQKPERYAERKMVDSSTRHSLVPLIDFDKLTAPETRTLLALLRKGSPEADDPQVTRTARPAIELVPQEILEAEEADWVALDGPEAPALEGPKAPDASGGEAPALVGPPPAVEDPAAAADLEAGGRTDVRLESEQAFVPVASRARPDSGGHEQPFDHSGAERREGESEPDERSDESTAHVDAQRNRRGPATDSGGSQLAGGGKGEISPPAHDG